MKTTNNVQKTAKTQIRTNLSRFAAAIGCFVLISFTVSAQGFWEQLLTNSSFGKMASLMVEQENPATEVHYTTNPVAAEARLEAKGKAMVIEPATDPELTIEAWMVKNLNTKESAISTKVDADEELEIEDWMINSTFFEEAVVSTEQEQPLEVEAWMHEGKIWGM